ncbi:TPA: hypothetical protein N0F65_010536 [Lagenidium giganteum]|uniref:E2 ubiquitin-conjugating enzyme n=1 Tax=Lagenidium giganteum TaxID=4803 RepID=A0AAV2Z5T1_9STRA|nr:TPA: hypothetical protein N0F65_010536 [Lagenidium giganteum]
MASALATKRLQKEFMALQRKPVENIVAVPLETNILEWHYVITGTADTPYAGGHYHGVLKFPPEYPMKPPAVMMMTPNGRFKTNQRLCLSMSDFHPETWNPMWSVSSILTGLYSFMLENQPTLGSINTTDAQKRKYAATSLEANCANATFRKMFPELVELHQKQQEERAQQLGQDGATDGAGALTSVGDDTIGKHLRDDWSALVCVGIIMLFLAILVLFLFP